MRVYTCRKHLPSVPLVVLTASNGTRVHVCTQTLLEALTDDPGIVCTELENVRVCTRHERVHEGRLKRSLGVSWIVRVCMCHIDSPLA